jgi:uncharacterized protein (DUF927 family)
MNAINTPNEALPPPPHATILANGVGEPQEAANGFRCGDTAAKDHPAASGPQNGAAGAGRKADPFAPVTDAERLAGESIGAFTEAGGSSETLWEPETPAPFDPAPGDATVQWIYRDSEGKPLFAVRRFDKRGGEKVTLPRCYGRRVWTDKAGAEHDETGWHYKTPADPRAIYGLDHLAARPDAPVIVCEGEKTADAAGRLFPDHVAVTSQGGARAAGKSDWFPLAGRHVTIWPDRDAPGAEYAKAVADRLRIARAASVRIVEVPASWPEGWDVADPLPEGVAHETLTELLADAPEALRVEYPGCYKMTKAGLYNEAPPKSADAEPQSVFVCKPFEVLAKTRNDEGGEWGTLIEWNDADQRRHEWAVPMRLLHDKGGATLAAELEAMGLPVSTRGYAHLVSFLSSVAVNRHLKCVERAGWHETPRGPVFVLPGGEGFGRGAGGVKLQDGRASGGRAFHQSGTLETWQHEVARLCPGNSRLILAASIAFAGPLIELAGDASGGVHLVGSSSIGKTASLRVAASVWGPGDGAQIRQWRMTANGIEAVAAEASDTLLILDELGQVDGREAGDIAYMLANGAGKIRAGKTGAARAVQTWRLMILSSGELTIAAKMAEANRRAPAGVSVRLLDLPADAGAGLGVFETLHGIPDAKRFAEHLSAATKAHHGAAGRAFLAALAADRGSDAAVLAASIKALRARFIKAHLPPGADAQVGRAAERFALIAAAGEIATSYGVTGWPEGEAERAAGVCFRAWLAERGFAGPAEDQTAVSQVRQFIEAHGESRFSMLGGDDAAQDGSRTINRAGWRRRAGGEDGEGWEYLILPEVFKTEVCRGLNPKIATAALAACGLLAGYTLKNPAASLRIGGEGRRRVYCVSGKIMGED